MKWTAIFSTVLILASTQAMALAVKHDSEAAKGCTKLISVQDSVEVMKRFNIRTSGAKPEEVQALGTGLSWVEKLNGGRPPSEAVSKNKDGYLYKFENGSAFSHQRGWGIAIRRSGKHEFGKNVAQLMHELGHLIGNQGGYQQYRQNVGTAPCRVSGYSDDRFNEQFAEVFAAFVTKPELITNNSSRACKDAYRFFSRVFFAAGEQAKSCD